MSLLKKSLIAIIIFIGYIAMPWQAINKRILKVKLKDKYQGGEQNNMESLLPVGNEENPYFLIEPAFLISIPDNSFSSAAYILYFSSNPNSKCTALTFDDGPDEYYTPQILDILKENNVKATFFIVGLRAQAHPEMVRRIVSEGHSIGNHTWDHRILSGLSVDEVKEEVQKTEQELYSITGIKTAMFRPPYGAASGHVVAEISSLGYNIINWNADTRDWNKTSVPQIIRYVNKQVRPGGIVLMHCAGGRDGNLSNTVKALPKIISSLKSQDYGFVTVEDLLYIQSSK